MNISCRNLDDPDRDYLLLSKGHAVPALYGTLAEVGILDHARLKNHLTIDDDIYWHPNRNVPGVEFHSGSLGHILPVATGVALDCKMSGGRNRVTVVLGDGELNEGSNWEACLFAAARRLDNLIIVVDRNRFQANMRTERLVPLDPLEEKFNSFRLSAVTIDGHDFSEMADTFSRIPFDLNRPSVVIAETLRGKGLPKIESRADCWFCNFMEDEIGPSIDELTARMALELMSKTSGVSL
jgi:transketolase